MKALLVLFINSFDTLKLEIDVTTLKYYGSTDGYDDDRQYNDIVFTLSNHLDTDKIIEEIKSKFNLNKQYCDVNNYVWRRDKTEDHELNNKPRIGIRFSNGYKGMINPPSFQIRPIEL